MKLLKVTSLISVANSTDILSLTYQFDAGEFDLDDEPCSIDYLIFFDHAAGGFITYAPCKELLAPVPHNQMLLSLINYLNENGMKDRLAIILNRWA